MNAAAGKTGKAEKLICDAADAVYGPEV